MLTRFRIKSTISRLFKGRPSPALPADLRLNATQILDPDDDDLLGIWALQVREFGKKEVDPYPEMQRWIREMREAASSGQSDLNEILLALKLESEVVGYLYAQHYIEQQLIFVSYLGVDKDVREAKFHGAEVLLRKLISICDCFAISWTAIVGEVERIRHDKDNNSFLFFYAFSRYSKKLSTDQDTGALFLLDLIYEQPALSPSELGRSSSSKYDLVYVAYCVVPGSAISSVGLTVES